MKYIVLTMFLILFIVTTTDAPKKKKGKSISEMKSPLSVSGRVWARKNCMFGEIISKGGIEVILK